MNAQLIKITKTYRDGSTFGYVYGTLNGRTRTPDSFFGSARGGSDTGAIAFATDELAENTGNEFSPFPASVKTYSEPFTVVTSDDNPQVDQTRTVFELVSE